MNQPVNAPAGGPLYQKRIPIFTRSVNGKFRLFKWAVLCLAYTVFFGLVWLPWSRLDGAPQAVLFDMVGRRFFIFDLVVYPQDLVALSLLLFVAATLLFFVTSLIGRAWCGYFCFQTLWTDFYILIEHLLQGERPTRMRLYNAPWGLEKALRVGGTHLLWILFSWWTAVTFVLYFGYAPDLLSSFFAGTLASAGYIAIVTLTLSTYVAAGLIREQVCIYICPYGRFQAVMYEPETLVVAYEFKRGEGAKGRAPVGPGMKTHAERTAKEHGDCIDCGFCVQVCPAGIDIRDGLQYKCISCGLCIDACNNIMDSMSFPRGLIRYDAQPNIDAGNSLPAPMQWKRLKTLGYGLALVSISGLLIYTLASRSHFEESVQQVRQPLFVVLSDGMIRNRYLVRITNKTDKDQVYDIKALGLPETALDMGDAGDVLVRPGKSLMIPVNVKLPYAQARGTSEFDFVITPRGKPAEAATRRAKFYSREEN